MSVPHLYTKYKNGHPGGEELVGLGDFADKLSDIIPDRSKSKIATPVFSAPTVETEESLIDQALDHLKIKFNATGEEITMDTYTIAASKLEGLINGYVVNYNNQSQVFDNNKMLKFRRTFTITDVKAIYLQRLVMRDIENRKKLSETLKFDSTYQEYAHNILTAILKKMRPVNEPDWDLEFHVLMLKQWLWQVKQHIIPELLGDVPIKTVLDYYLINLSSDSGEGAGKTTFLRKLCLPLLDYYHEGTLENVASQSDYAVFTSNYIVLFDELSFGRIPATERGKVMTTLKYILTAENMSNRVYHTQNFQKMRRLFSALSTSNGSLTSMIYDPTGMRRFYEIKVNPDRDTTRYTLINNMQPLKVWKGIDETNRKGFIKTDSEEFKKLQRIQRGYIKKDAIDIYLDSSFEDGIEDSRLLTIKEAESKGYLAKLDTAPHNLKQEELADYLGVGLLTIQEFRQNLLAFYDSDQDEKRWLQKREGLRDILKSKGFWTLLHNNSILIPIKKSGGSNYGYNI